MSKLSRRGLFKSLSNRQEGSLIYIPYWENLKDFDNCSNCSDTPCVNACDEGIIRIENKIPALFFENSGCTYCDECANACENEVLFVEKKRQIGAIFSINTTKCLAWNGVICSTCKDACYENAIEFFGLFRPIINDKCTSCGFCVSPCPTKALDFKEIS